MKKLIILKNGFISDIRDDFDSSESYSGCPTCGWDYKYISEIEFFIYENGNLDSEWYKISSSSSCDFVFSVSDILKIFIEHMEDMKNMEVQEFKIWIRDKLLNS